MADDEQIHSAILRRLPFRGADAFNRLNGLSSGSYQPSAAPMASSSRERWLGGHASHSINPDRDPSSTAGRGFSILVHEV
jgi:hypothetical protein